MFFWNTNKLKEKLKADSLTDGEVFPYFILYMIFFSIPLPESWDSYNLWDYIDEIHLFLVPILGAFYAFSKNKGKNGSNFLPRYFSIGWVLMLRFYILSFFILSSVFLADYFLPSLLSSENQWFGSLIFLGIQVAYYYRLGYHMEDVAVSFSNKSINSD